MDRRDFIKGSLMTVAAVTLGGALGTLAADTKTDEGKAKKMKILVITGSPRKGGNSSTLADSFAKGAAEAGHEVVRFDAAFKDVHPCTGCNSCGMNGPCVFKDDFEFVRKHVVDADLVVFATPMYYFGISAQIKAVIDRFYAINGKIHVPKQAVLLMTHYEVLLKYLGWTDAGQIIAPGVWPVGAIKSTKYPDEAYKLGKSVKAKA